MHDAGFLHVRDARLFAANPVGADTRKGIERQLDADAIVGEIRFIPEIERGARRGRPPRRRSRATSCWSFPGWCELASFSCCTVHRDRAAVAGYDAGPGARTPRQPELATGGIPASPLRAGPSCFGRLLALTR